MIVPLYESSLDSPHRSRDGVVARCADLADLEAVLQQLHGEEPYLAVALGDGLTPARDAYAMTRGLLDLRARTACPLLLRNDRGSIGQDPAFVAELAATHPDLRLALDFQEWCLGSELLLGDCAAWKGLLRVMAPQVLSLRAPTAGPERRAPDRGLVALAIRQLMLHRYRWLRRTCARGPRTIFEVVGAR